MENLALGLLLCVLVGFSILGVLGLGKGLVLLWEKITGIEFFEKE